MADLLVERAKLRASAEEVSEISGSVKKCSRRIDQICANFCLDGNVGMTMKNNLWGVSSEIEEQSVKIRKAGSTLGQIVTIYRKTENQITATKVNMEDIEDDSKEAFDEYGQYGGNQGSPMNNWEELADIVRKYYPDMSDREVENYLKKLNSEGCGYVAMINTIFEQYRGKESEFQETFGFPMYDENGDLNYDAMVTDFYAATDNHNEKTFLWITEDSIKTGRSHWKKTARKFTGKYLGKRAGRKPSRPVRICKGNRDKYGRYILGRHGRYRA